MQLVIARIVTPDGFPLAYEVLPGNTLDKQTRKDFLAMIERQYGKSDRVWMMGRGIPAEETLALMSASDPSGHYLVGTLKGHLANLKRSVLDKPLERCARARDAQALEQRRRDLWLGAERRTP